MGENLQSDDVVVSIYVAQHCSTCEYAYEIAELIRTRFPQVDVRLIDMETTAEEIPDAVFATPTYLLNGRVWSLGNPSEQKVQDTFENLLQAIIVVYVNALRCRRQYELAIRRQE